MCLMGLSVGKKRFIIFRLTSSLIMVGFLMTHTLGLFHLPVIVVKNQAFRLESPTENGKHPGGDQRLHPGVCRGGRYKVADDNPTF